jgi:DNA-binding response OmpR family regulator
MPSHRILYVGRDLTLLDFLRDLLKKTDDAIVRCPDGRLSFCLIESDIKYSLLLFDAELPDMTGAELECFARSLPHREQTPIIILKNSSDLDPLVSAIMRAIHR